MNIIKKNILNFLNLLFIPLCERRYRPYLHQLGILGLRELKAKVSDPREIMLEAARMLNVSEIDVALQVAKKLGLPCLARVPIVEVESGPTGMYPDLEDFDSVGAIPLINENIVSGVVCADPWLAQGLIEKLSGFNAQLKSSSRAVLPLYIAPWQEIQKALELSRELLSKKSEARKFQQGQRLTQLSYSCLALMLKHVEQARADFLELDLRSDRCSYSFVTGEGLSASGQIDILIREHLLNILNPKNTVDGAISPEIYLPEINHPIKVKCLAEAETFRLTVLGSRSNVLAFPDLTNLSAAASQLEVQPSNAAPIAQLYANFVLLVDDNQTFAQVLNKFLERQNFKSKILNSCKEALDFLAASSELPAVIICDLHLPGMDGHEFTRHLKSSPALARIPLVILTSDEDLETELKLLAAGADIFLTKNQDPRLLCAHVKRLVAKHGKQEAA